MAPQKTAQFAVDTKEFAEHQTISFEFNSNARQAKCSPEVALLDTTEYLTLQKLLRAFSNLMCTFPVVIKSFFRELLTSRISLLLINCLE